MLDRIKVAFVAPSLRILGGQAVQADRLLSAWKNDPDVEAWLVPVNPLPPRALAFTQDVKFLRTVVNELTYLPLLVRELARADVVHVFSASYSSFLLAPLPAMLVARALGKPVVLNYRSGQAPDHLQRSAVARNAIARVDLNVVPSRFLVEVFHEFGIDASIIPNIVDLDRFQFRDRNPLRPRLVSTRNFEALYNVTTTVRAFALVQQRWPDASLTLVGGGPQEAQLRELVDQLRLRNVTFLGRVKPGEIAQHYAANDIYIQSPNIDNMPTSVIEAFASGLPVVSTEAGGVPAILTHERHGLLAPLGDYDRLAAHVLRLLDNPVWARAMARAAFDTCQACTWPAVREQWLRAYRSAAAIAARRRARTARAFGERRTDSGSAAASAERPPHSVQAFAERRAHPRRAERRA
ncbi:MAG TPA: glycosyltransferase family 4 protein [Vicinamibacterales bacterium]|nr:glycosyltransferase family 4 protein [Vicinamibacterales bacterium]